jgi:hypothetical protein
MPYETQTVQATATDGTVIDLVIPADVPLNPTAEELAALNERAEYLRGLYTKHVEHPDGHWKGQATAYVPEELADDVAEAMDFVGSIVDERHPRNPDGHVTLYSRGYWAHGF